MVDGARDKLTLVVAGWPGVTSAPHRFGGTEYRFGKRELGHVHGDSLVDIPFPKKVRDRLVESGRVEPHHWVPDSGWVSLPIRDDEDLQWALILLRHSYELAQRQRRRRQQPAREALPETAPRRTGIESPTRRTYVGAA